MGSEFAEYRSVFVMNFVIRVGLPERDEIGKGLAARHSHLSLGSNHEPNKN